MSTRHADLLILVAFLIIFVALTTATSAKSVTGDQNARFTKVTYRPRIPAETKDTWTFAVYNANCSENDQNASRFFLIVYIDNELLLNEFNGTQYKTWPCSTGSTVSRNLNINGWHTLRPTTHDLRIELYWNSKGTAYLEDTTSFIIAVTVHVPLQNILATGYFAAYLIACIVLFSYDYIQGLEE